MGCLPPHEEVTAPWKDNRQTPRGTPHGARFAAWRRCHRAEYLAPLGRYLAHWAPPAKSKWPLELFQGPFAATSTGALLLENESTHAETAVRSRRRTKVRRVLRKGGIRSANQCWLLRRWYISDSSSSFSNWRAVVFSSMTASSTPAMRAKSSQASRPTEVVMQVW